MNDPISVCPKCQGTMIRGFIPEQVLGETRISTWSDGAPKWTFWRGTRGSGERTIPVGAFRCSECGYLELYARDEFAPIGVPAR